MEVTLSKAANGPPPGPRPAGSFLAGAPREPTSGIRLLAPDGRVFYLAVFTESAFERDELEDEPG